MPSLLVLVPVTGEAQTLLIILGVLTARHLVSRLWHTRRVVDLGVADFGHGGFREPESHLGGYSAGRG